MAEVKVTPPENITISKSFINSKVFNEGINNTLVKPQTGHVFLMLYSTLASGKVLATSSSLTALDELEGNLSGVYWEEGPKESGSPNGGTIHIRLIPADHTKDFMQGASEPIKATSFALVWQTEVEKGNSGLKGGTEVTFPQGGHVDRTILLAGELTNKPSISGDTNFQFNESSIQFTIS